MRLFNFSDARGAEIFPVKNLVLIYLLKSVADAMQYLQFG